MVKICSRRLRRRKTMNACGDVAMYLDGDIDWPTTED